MSKSNSALIAANTMPTLRPSAAGLRLRHKQIRANRYVIGIQTSKIGKLMAGFAETGGIAGVAFSAGVMKTTLPQTKPMIQIRMAKPSALNRFNTI